MLLVEEPPEVSYCYWYWYWNLRKSPIAIGIGTSGSLLSVLGPPEVYATSGRTSGSLLLVLVLVLVVVLVFVFVFVLVLVLEPNKELLFTSIIQAFNRSPLSSLTALQTSSSGGLLLALRVVHGTRLASRKNSMEGAPCLHPHPSGRARLRACVQLCTRGGTPTSSDACCVVVG
jgi:hypothetical protein